MDPEERDRIEADAMRRQDVENRLSALEGKIKWMLISLGGLGSAILTSIWDQLKMALFK